MEIQGSGKIKLQNGKNIRLGYAAQNGRKYVAIGRVLKARKEIKSPITMKKIRGWLNNNPWHEKEILNENSSVVFFRKVKKGPIGAQNLVLTPMRSLAVDPKYIPLGFPLWLETENQHRLVIAQDTGGAIKGVIRGDLFWGSGKKAEEGAGKMQEKGTYYLLLPKRAKEND
jgi:membrane-bound lytic murein transglycosylase A